MASLKLLRQDDFTGGLNLRADQFQLQPNESPDMLNVEIDPRGGVFSRGAMRRINSTDVAGTWNPEKMIPFYGTTSYVMLTTGKSGVNNGDVFYSTGGNFTSLSLSVSYEFGAGMAPWGNKLYITRGHGTTSSVWAPPGSATGLTGSGPTWQNSYASPGAGGFFPRANHCITHAGKVFVAHTVENSVEYPNRVRWSHPNFPEAWAESDYIDINMGGQGILGLAVVAGHLVVMKENAVFAIFGYDSETFQVIELSRSVGPSSPHAFTQTEYGVYFFSHPEGLMFYNGDTLRNVFEPLQPMFDLNNLNVPLVDEVYVSYINRRIWVSVPYSKESLPAYPSSSFVYDPTIGRSGAWTRFSTADGRGPVAGCTFVGDDGANLHLAAHPTSPAVLRVDMYSQYQDNISGTNADFASKYRTRWLDAGNYSQKKMFRRPDIIAKQTQFQSFIDIKVFKDYEEAEGTEWREYQIDVPLAGGGMVWGTGTWGSGTWGSPNQGSQILRGRSSGLARAIQVEYNGPGGKPWGLNSFTIKYSPRKVTV